MSVDLTMVPWNRLAKLAPPGTIEVDLQAAADRWSLNTDIYNAAADLWEDAALMAALIIDLAPDPSSDADAGTGKISSITQDGISVTYASDALAGDNQSSRSAQYGAMMATVRRLRARGKPTSPLVHDPKYNPWLNTERPQCDPEIIIPVLP